MNTTNTSEDNQDWAAQTEDIENQQPLDAPAEGEEGEAPVEEDAGPSEMTLDEWKAMQSQKKTQQFNIRRPGEGCDNSQWKKTYLLKKKEEEESEEDDDDEVEYEDDHRKKNYVPIEITFYDQARRGGGRDRGGRGGRGGPGRGGPRGGRGGGRGGGGPGGFGGPGERSEGGGYRGGRGGGGRGGRGGGEGRGGRGSGGPREQAPNVEDEMDFPSLGKATTA